MNVPRYYGDGIHDDTPYIAWMWQTRQLRFAPKRKPFRERCEDAWLEYAGGLLIGMMSFALRPTRGAA